MVSEHNEKSTRDQETGHGGNPQIVDIDSICPCPENDDFYNTIDPTTPENRRLQGDIRERGILEPIAISQDSVIVSGHRRYFAALEVGLEEVPVRYLEISYADDKEAFIELLVAYNRDQREKTFAEKLREEATRVNPYQSWCSLLEERSKPREIVESFEIEGFKTRSLISKAKKPMLDRLLEVLEDNDTPMTVRQIHYQFLNAPPLKHASKPKSTYRNTKSDYKNLVDLVARARTEGIIPMEWISDGTRGVSDWSKWCHLNSREFINSQLESFMNRYWRNLQQSQPDHIEILAEKNTIIDSVNKVAQEYTIPTTSLRGYCSISPRYELVKRFQKSGKERLILLIVSDFDPDGEEIAQSFARSLRDEFEIDQVEPVKVALKYEHIERFNLIPNMEAKQSSSQYQKFFDRYGTDDVFEVEALSTDQLKLLLQEAIDSVMDLDLFNQEIEQEKHDAAEIRKYRGVIQKYIRDNKPEESN